MLIHATGSIRISKDTKTVFAFIADLGNDRLWRKEINSTTVSGRPQINTLATENSFLSNRTPNYISNLLCIACVDNKEIIYQTLPDNKFYLKSLRQVESVSPNETKMTYSLAFDKAIVKHGLGFNLPTLLVNLVVNRDMKKYLAELKRILESNDMPPART